MTREHADTSGVSPRPVDSGLPGPGSPIWRRPEQRRVSYFDFSRGGTSRDHLPIPPRPLPPGAPGDAA